MSVNGQLLIQSFESTASTLASWVPVKLGTINGKNKTVIVCTGATDKVIGVTVSDAVFASQAVDVAFQGSNVKLQCASAVTAGDAVVLDASTFTKIATATLASSGTAKTLIGFALESGDTDDFIEVTLHLEPCYV
jgi:hypothetical protein